MTRVSGIDVMMLYGETPSWQMHVSALMVADPAKGTGRFDPAAFGSALAERVALAAPFRWRIREIASGLDAPVFVDDGHFELDRHFHRVALPAPGDRTQLGALVGQLMSRPLDRSDPLWEFWLIEGLEGDRFATFTKMHHAVIDGASGADLTTLLLDTEPDPPARPDFHYSPPDPPPSTLEAALGAARHLLATPLRAGLYALQLAEQGAIAGRHLLRGSKAGLPFSTPKSSLNGPLSARRDFAFADLDLRGVLRVKEAHQVKANDVILAVVAGALRSYLEGCGGLPERSLVAEVPVNIRTEAQRNDVGTHVANSFVTLATDVDDPVERLLTIHRSANDAKALQRELTAHKRLDLSDVLPPVLMGAALRGYGASGLEPRVPPIYSAIVSNVRGPDIDLYVAGAAVEGIYPMGPLLYAAGLNITAFTLHGRIHFGLVACPDVVKDPWAVANCLSAALDELLAATGARAGAS